MARPTVSLASGLVSFMLVAALFFLKAQGMGVGERANATPRAVPRAMELDKNSKIPYGVSRQTAVKTSVELLWEEIAMNWSAAPLVAAAIIATPMTTHAQDKKPAPLPEIVVTAPAPVQESPEMWGTHAPYFERFKQVWINCPARVFEAGRYIAIAEWFNKHHRQYEHILATCKKYEAHVPRREWPPGPKTARVMDRYFSWRCEGGACGWVRVR